MSSSKLFSTETTERYARALFEVSKESSEIDQIELSLKNFLDVYNSSPELISFIKNPTQTNHNQLSAINIISEKFDSIPYVYLTGVSDRVKRIYIDE